MANIAVETKEPSRPNWRVVDGSAQDEAPVAIVIDGIVGVGIGVPLPPPVASPPPELPPEPPPGLLVADAGIFVTPVVGAGPSAVLLPPMPETTVPEPIVLGIAHLHTAASV